MGAAGPLRITVLGSGTSVGVPTPGCHCAVCTSADPRDNRLRPSVLLQYGGHNVVIDTTPDFRTQMLRAKVDHLDAVLFTHSHADHIFGLDDVRIFNFRQRSPIPCYGSEETLRNIRRSFAYVFEAGQEGGGKPQLDLLPVREPFTLLDRTFVPVPVWHGTMEVFGYRTGAFAYVTDCNRIPESSYELLAGVEILILDALRHRPHSTHFSVEQATEVAARIGARRTIFTHMTHEVDQDDPLPAGVEFGYDGLAFDAD